MHVIVRAGKGLLAFFLFMVAEQNYNFVLQSQDNNFQSNFDEGFYIEQFWGNWKEDEVVYNLTSSLCALKCELIVCPLFRRNLPEHATDDYLGSCRYDPSNSTDKYCPIFALGKIVSEAGHSYADMAREVERWVTALGTVPTAVCVQFLAQLTVFISSFFLFSFLMVYETLEQLWNGKRWKHSCRKVSSVYNTYSNSNKDKRTPVMMMMKINWYEVKAKSAVLNWLR